jgi:hypothetical protein
MPKLKSAEDAKKLIVLLEVNLIESANLCMEAGLNHLAGTFFGIAALIFKDQKSIESLSYAIDKLLDQEFPEIIVPNNPHSMH